MITQERLKELLEYNPDTGEFIWLVRRGGNAIIGSIAGGLNVTGYLEIKVDSVRYKGHRLAWLYVHGEFPEDQIDHINHVRSDNRIINLRDVTNKVNGKNQSLHRTNTSGVSGVNWHSGKKVWVARAFVGGDRLHIYQGTSLFDACCSRKSIEVDLDYHENHGRK